MELNLLCKLVRGIFSPYFLEYTVKNKGSKIRGQNNGSNKGPNKGPNKGSNLFCSICSRKESILMCFFPLVTNLSPHTAIKFPSTRSVK